MITILKHVKRFRLDLCKTKTLCLFIIPLNQNNNSNPKQMTILVDKQTKTHKTFHKI